MPEQMESAAPPKSSSHLVRNGCLGLIGIFGALIALGMIVDDGSKDDKAGQAAAVAAPAVKTTASELFAAYEKNQIAAGQAYEGRPLEVAGVVQAINESMGTPVLELVTSNQFMPIGAHFPAESASVLAQVQKGQKVTVRCRELREAGGFLSLQDCGF